MTILNLFRGWRKYEIFRAFDAFCFIGDNFIKGSDDKL